MSFSTINTLRKAGALDEAHELAMSEYALTPDDIWIKRALAWVLYSKIKAEPTLSANQLIDYLQSILNLDFSDKEDVFFSSLAFGVGKLLFYYSKEDRFLDDDKISCIWNELRELPFKKPSESYSFLAKAFYGFQKEWSRYLDFCDEWGWANLCEDDYKSQSFEGRQYMSLAEKMMIAYSKKLLDILNLNRNFSQERIRLFIELLEKQSDAHPEYQYVDYYLAKLYLATGDHEEAIATFLPFARKKKNEFWIWDLLSELHKEDAAKRKAALCKALLCKTKPLFLVKVRKKLIELFLEDSAYAYARFEFEKLKATYLKENIKLPIDILWLDDGQCFNEKDSLNDYAYLKSQSLLANSLLYDECWNRKAVVAGIDRHASIAFVITTDNLQLRLKNISEHLQIGEILDLLVAKDPDNDKLLILSYDKCDFIEYPQLVEKESAIFKLSDSGEFGFLGNVFVPKSAIQKLRLIDRSSYDFFKMKSYNKKKDVIGWSLLRIE